MQNLPSHLADAGRRPDLRRLLLDYNWMQAKLEVTSVPGLLADYDLALHDNDLRLVQGAIRLSAYILALDKTQLRSQLLGRLLYCESYEVKAMLNQARLSKAGTWLRPVTCSLLPPDGPVLGRLEGHGSSVTSIAVSQDGRYAVSGAHDATLKIWDIDMCMLAKTLKGHHGAITAVAMTVDGSWAVSASRDHTLKIWNLRSGELVRTFRGHTHTVKAALFNTDHHQVISASSDRTLRVWDLRSGRQVRMLKGHDSGIQSIALIPPGQFAVSASRDGTLMLWDLIKGKALQIYKGHKDVVTAVTVTPEGRYIISGSYDKTIRVWDVKSGNVCGILTGHKDTVTDVAVTPDGERIVSASKDRTIKVWSLDSGEVILTLKGHTDAVTAVAVTPEDERVVSASRDRTIRIWHLKTSGSPPKYELHEGPVTAVIVTLDGRKAVSVSRHKTVVWDLTTYKPLRVLAGERSAVTALVSDARGRKAFMTVDFGHATPRRVLRVRDLDTGERPASFRSRVVHALGYSPNGRYAAVVPSYSGGTRMNILEVWDLETRKRCRVLEADFEGNVLDIKLTNDARWVVCVLEIYGAGTLMIWDVEKAKLAHTIWIGNAVRALVVNSAGDRVVLASDSHRGRIDLEIWDLKKGERLRHEEVKTGDVTNLALTQNDIWIIGSSVDRTLRVWDLVPFPVSEFRVFHIL